MIKRIAIGSLFGILFIGALVFYFLGKQVKIVDSMFKAIPLDAAYIIDVADYNEFHKAIITGNKCWNTTLELSFLKDLKSQLQLIDSITKTSIDLKNLVSEKHSIMISGHPSGKDELQGIFYFKISTAKDFKTIENIILSGSRTIQGSSRSYEGVTIQDMVLKGKRNEGFSFTWVNGIMILSHSSILLEDAVRQLSATESILNKNGLNETVKTAGKSSVLNFYINFDQLPRLASRFIHSSFNKEINFLRNFGSWVELDLSIKSDILIFNGFSFANITKPSFETIFKNQKPVKLEIFSKLPSSVNTFGVLGISNLDQYLLDCASFLETHGEGNTVQQSLIQLKSKENIDLLADFHNLFDHEAGFVFLDSHGDTISKYGYSLIRIKNKEDGLKQLNTWISAYSDKENSDYKTLIQELNVSNDSKIQLFNLPFGNIPAMLFGKMFAINDNRYCYVTDNYMVFGNSPAALIEYEKQLLTGSTLSSDNAFSNFSEYFSSQSNFFFYNLPEKSEDIYNTFLKKEIAREMLNDEYKLRQFQAFVFQFNIGENGLIYNNIFLKCNTPSMVQNIKPNWETQLDGQMVSKPILIKNGSDKEMNIAVTDSKNHIYLLNKLGRILWKSDLPEPVLSDIWPIDYYKNGKTQLLFNTRSKIYIIDKNGNNLENFPLTLNSPATNGLILVDYDKNRDYRIFYASENNNINVLSKEGDPIFKWSFSKTDSKVIQPIQYFRVEEKDLLVFTDQNHLYVTDRKGNLLIHTDKNYTISVHNKVALINSKSLKEAKFLFTDTSGKVIQAGIIKPIQELPFQKMPANHWFDVFDVDGDGVKDMIFSYGRIVKVMNQKNKEIFTLTLDKPLSFRPCFFDIANESTTSAIGIITGENSTISLFDNHGKLFKGFPLKGNTQFSLTLMKNPENSLTLISGTSNNFLCDYSVQ